MCYVPDAYPSSPGALEWLQAVPEPKEPSWRRSSLDAPGYPVIELFQPHDLLLLSGQVPRTGFVTPGGR